MRVGVLFTTYRSQGGVYQYSVEMLRALSKIKSYDFVIFSTSKEFPPEFTRVKNFKILNLYSKSTSFVVMVRGIISYFLYYSRINVMRPIYELHLFGFVAFLYKLTQRSLIRWLDIEKLDLMIYPTPVYLSFLANIPFLITVYDLEHRNRKKFKETIGGGRWEYREYCLNKISEKAFRIFVDSEISRRKMVYYYRNSRGKLIPLKYIPPSTLNANVAPKRTRKISKKLNLFDKYIFYPAKFWPHKNHLNLIEAIRILKERGKIVNLVLTGSSKADFSTFAEVMRRIKKFRLENQVKYLGYVTEEELSVIYKKAAALVMPTFLGPTNIPVYEAWFMETPVLYSDIKGCREQLGDAGLLINPTSPKDIADKILKIYMNKGVRARLAQRGKKRLKEWGRRDFGETVKAALRDFEEAGGK